ncbi:M20 family metallopeptidase [Bradyrhizobium sp. WSM3983]|uniref:M20 family metallopeptidase n=1 Tax=Bradyrhizobium sp. WSM3983 TaxID=1038867 RepID=UPI000480C2CB|nr:M20 family metallopeptidase [Bradyrhizobium sp. WSM3983]
MLSNSAKPVWDIVQSLEAGFHKLSDDIWDHPELNYQEFYAANAHRAQLDAHGFRVTEGLSGIPTALMGEAGEGGPVIAILGEFDALPGLSQEAGLSVQQPIALGASGHGCGHHLLGSASLLAAVAVKQWLVENKLQGRVRYYGCPAEEGGSSKSFLVRDGAFEDVDVAISWHPAGFMGVYNPVSLACVELEFTFHGLASHASAAPHLGRSALDAVELMNVGVNYMREHMPTSARVHYAMIDGGGISPNVVQPRAVVRHLVRARTLGEMWELVARVKKIADGAALMTETSVEVNQLSGEANIVANAVLENAMQENLLQLGGPGFDDADRQFAKQIQSSLSIDDIRAAYIRFGFPSSDESLSEQVAPLYGASTDGIGSTDVGTVSWVVPTVQCRVSCYAAGTPYHSWQLVAQGKAPAAHKGLTQAAKAMAGLASDLIKQPALLTAAKAEFAQFRENHSFINPVGPEAKPALRMSMK